MPPQGEAGPQATGEDKGDLTVVRTCLRSCAVSTQLPQTTGFGGEPLSRCREGSKRLTALTFLELQDSPRPPRGPLGPLSSAQPYNLPSQNLTFSRKKFSDLQRKGTGIFGPWQRTDSIWNSGDTLNSKEKDPICHQHPRNRFFKTSYQQDLGLQSSQIK